MNFFSWVMFGVIMGILANVIDPHPDKSLIGAVGLGVVGSVVGGFIASYVFNESFSGFDFQTLLVAVLVSLLVLFVQGLTVKRT
jgi:uncharacterized membrane protein YeaQ/YmgE (transglycosylase-associated protein family)